MHEGVCIARKELDVTDNCVVHIFKEDRTFRETRLYDNVLQAFGFFHDEIESPCIGKRVQLLPCGEILSPTGLETVAIRIVKKIKFFKITRTRDEVVEEVFRYVPFFIFRIIAFLDAMKSCECNLFCEG
jgi:hypothetical protein